MTADTNKISALERINALRGKLAAPARRYPTNIPAIDTLFALEDENGKHGGIPAGLFIVAGDPGTGKSTYVLQVIQSLAVEGHITLFFSFEGKSNVSDVIRRCGMNQGAKAHFLPALMDQTDVPATSKDLCALLEQLASENKTGLPLAIGLDSFKNVNAAMGMKGQKIAIADLFALSERLKKTGPGIILFLIAHIDRQSRGKNKDNKKLQGAAELEELCDCTMLFINLTPPSDTPVDWTDVALQINKNRHGQTGRYGGYRVGKPGIIFPKVKV